MHEFFSSSFCGKSSWSFLTTNFSGEVALAAATEAVEMPYVLTSNVELVNKDPANVSDTAEAVISYHCRLSIPPLSTPQLSSLLMPDATDITDAIKLHFVSTSK